MISSSVGLTPSSVNMEIPLHSFAAGSAVASDSLQQGKDGAREFAFKTRLSPAQVLETFPPVKWKFNFCSYEEADLLLSSQ